MSAHGSSYCTSRRHEGSRLASRARPCDRVRRETGGKAVTQASHARDRERGGGTSELGPVLATTSIMNDRFSFLSKGRVKLLIYRSSTHTVSSNVPGNYNRADTQPRGRNRQQPREGQEYDTLGVALAATRETHAPCSPSLGRLSLSLSRNLLSLALHLNSERAARPQLAGSRRRRAHEPRPARPSRRTVQ